MKLGITNSKQRPSRSRHSIPTFIGTTCRLVHCSGAYSSTTSLPSVLAGKCAGTTCTTLTTEMATVKSCLSNPSAAACTGQINSLPKAHLTHLLQFSELFSF